MNSCIKMKELFHKASKESTPVTNTFTHNNLKCAKVKPEMIELINFIQNSNVREF